MLIVSIAANNNADFVFNGNMDTSLPDALRTIVGQEK
jgi:hypothetical protein